MSPSPADVPFDSPVVERGFGLFETVLLVGRRGVLWEAHVSRLLATLRRFALPAPSPVTLHAAAREAVQAARSAPGERALRVAWIATGADAEDPAAWRLDVSVRPVPATTLARRGGSRCVTLPPWLRRDTPSVKSTSYFSAVTGLRMARKSGGDEGLFLDAGGSYLEGASTGLLCWDGEGWIVPEGPSLPSVTRAALAAASGSTPAPRPLRREDLLRGSVLAGSLTLAVPIVSLDGDPCAVPDPMRRAAAAFSTRLLTDPELGSELV